MPSKPLGDPLEWFCFLKDMSKFVDSLQIKVKGGHGGAGSAHFHREKYVPKGGPDGGDGGDGGSVFIRVNPQLHNLDHLDTLRTYKAAAGDPGKGRKKFGKKGEDFTLSVAPGTVIFDSDSNELICDMGLPPYNDGSEAFLVAAGGKGGLGNVHFASSVNQAPDYAQPGLPGEERVLRLDLKLIADIGFVGLPNAGKSTLLSKLTRAQPKIADYPFTTLIPQLGVLELESSEGPVRLKLADIPGIIKGAHQGSGLGLSFLQHIERVRSILYLIALDTPDPIFNLKILQEELKQYSKQLLTKPHIIVFNKLDLYPEEEWNDLRKLYLEELERLAPGLNRRVLFVSARESLALEELRRLLLESFFQKL